MSVKAIHLAELNSNGGKLNIQLNIYNPNKIDLTINRLGYELHINNKKITNELINQLPVIAQLKETEISIPVTFKYLEIFKSLIEALETKKISIQLLGVAQINSFEIPFEKNSVINL